MRNSDGKHRMHGGIATIAVAAIAAAAAWLAPADQGTGIAVHAQGTATARPEACTPRPGRLGISRIVEIDTQNGPRFGHQQYKDNDFLRPGEVVLTFDDGPLRRHSRAVLEALAAHCTRATFFLVGQMALVDPEMVREIGRAGHSVGIHTWTHRNLRAAGAANATREIELGISAVQRALGAPVAPFFRFPYLADSPQMLAHLAQRKFAVFSIDVDSRDFRTQDPRTMQRTVLEELKHKGKGILLFHDIQTSTARGIAGLLDELAARGFKVVHTVPKAPAASVASYDAMADTEMARRHRVAAANPMAQRAVVWPMAPAAGAPIEYYRPEAATGPAVIRGAKRPPPLPAATAGGAPPAPMPAPAPPVLAAPQPDAPAPTRPALRDTTGSDDWRRSVFQQ